jgi:predicted TIM-barrel fold metal-dependent hydrolase
MKILTVVLMLLVGVPASAQRHQPVIDMHLHASTADANGPPPLAICMSPSEGPLSNPREPWGQVFIARLKNPPCSNPVWSPTTDQAVMDQTIAVLNRRNVIGVLSGPLERVEQWKKAAPGRFIAGFQFQIGRETITPDELRRLYQAGRFAVLAEVTNQYVGIGPSDTLFEPYLAVAEELDIPVGIHIGIGPPGAPYLGFNKYRAALHSPLTLEDALVRHPKLRVYIAHAGWPMLDDLLAVLWAHPQVYVDTAAIVFALPRPEFYRYLRTIVEAGFGKRVMFGSDQMAWPGIIEPSIDVIESAQFLTKEQKRDPLYNIAARFLRLSKEEIARHHGRKLAHAERPNKKRLQRTP